MEQKKFMDIQALRPNNSQGFEVGDYVVIQEKIDGSNASICLDENEELVAFSRRKTLDPHNTLNGFYNYVQSLKLETMDKSWVVFGEWTGARNAIVYDEDTKNKWYVFDIFDKTLGVYLPQIYVEKFCELNHLNYVHTFYDGKFISWEHVMQFAERHPYGDISEGIVIKNETKIGDLSEGVHYPSVLKIVNACFSEAHKSKHKEVDFNKLAEREKAKELMSTIVTERRVEKELYKMRDDGLIPTDWSEKDMQTIARNLPSRVYQDCVKEENETVIAAGEYAGKMCSSITMKHAKKIVLGKE